MLSITLPRCKYPIDQSASHAILVGPRIHYSPSIPHMVVGFEDFRAVVFFMGFLALVFFAVDFFAVGFLALPALATFLRCAVVSADTLVDALGDEPLI